MKQIDFGALCYLLEFASSAKVLTPSQEEKWPLVCPRLFGVFVSLWASTARANGCLPEVSLCGVVSVIRKSTAAILAVAMAMFVPGALVAQEYVPGASRGKAAFLSTFPNFVEWPDGAFAAPNSPLVACVLGDFRFGTTLAEVSRDAMPHGRRISVKWIRNDQQVRGCHILFVSGSELPHYSKVIASVQGTSTFTVGETADFVAAGGMLSISFENDSVQFEVNLGSAREAHFRISSRLLALAHRVVDQTESTKS